MSIQKLLYLDLAAVLDYSTFDALALLENSAERERLAKFKKEYKSEMIGQGFGSLVGKALSSFARSAKAQPKLVEGAERFIIDVATFHLTKQKLMNI